MNGSSSLLCGDGISTGGDRDMPKFLGMEPKVWLWVLGGLSVVLVLYYVVKSRSGGGGGIPAGAPSDFGAGAGPSSPVSNTAPAESAGDQYSLQLQQLELESAQEELRQKKAMRSEERRVGKECRSR